MARVVNHHLVDQAELEELTSPRSDWLVDETQESHAAEFGFTAGPFTMWHRSVSLDDTTPADRAGQVAVTETIDFSLALPVWRVAATPLIKWQLRRPRGA